MGLEHLKFELLYFFKFETTSTPVSRQQNRTNIIGKSWVNTEIFLCMAIARQTHVVKAFLIETGIIYQAWFYVGKSIIHSKNRLFYQ